MIPVCYDEISTRPAGTDFTLRWHAESKFRPGGGTVFHLAFVFLWIFLCKHVSLQNWKPIDCNWFKNCLLELVSIRFHKIRSSRSEMFFKIGVLKCFAVFTGKHKCWCLFLIKFQTWKPAKRLQHRCFPVNTAKCQKQPPEVFCKKGVLRSFSKKRHWHRCFHANFAKFLRTPFLQNTIWRLLKFLRTPFLLLQNDKILRRCLLTFFLTD